MAVDTRARRSRIVLLAAVLVLGSCASGPMSTTAQSEAAPTENPSRAVRVPSSDVDDSQQVTGTMPTPAVDSTAPLSSAAIGTTAPDRSRIVIHGVGDTNLDPAYIPELARHGFGHAFEGLDGLFGDDDLTVVNLECTPSNRGVPSGKTFTFRCDPEALPVAAAAGVDVANLANNHSQDHGTEAMLDGRLTLEAAGIAPVGVGRNLDEATAPAIIEAGGWTIAVLGMGGVIPGESWLATADRPGMASGDNVDQMVAAVEAADALADLVVVTIHWGWELESEPRADDRARADAMIAAGADVVFGHHPHRLGPLELIDGRPVFWTLGNFVWPRFSDAGATTAIGRVEVGPEGDITACLIPAFIATSGRPELRGPVSCDVAPTDGVSPPAGS